jgi:hypothetical protein
VDELYLQLDDSVPSWFPRLRQYHLIDDQAEESLLGLIHVLEGMRDTEDLSLWGEAALYRRPEWEQVRGIAPKVFSSREIAHGAAVSADQLGSNLEKMFDNYLMFHGYTSYMRDYERIVLQAGEENTEGGTVSQVPFPVLRDCCHKVQPRPGCVA